MDLTLKELLNLLGDAGTLTLLIFIIWGGSKQIWVFGWQYRMITRERDEWKSLALSNTGLAVRALDVAKHSSLESP